MKPYQRAIALLTIAMNEIIALYFRYIRNKQCTN